MQYLLRRKIIYINLFCLILGSSVQAQFRGELNKPEWDNQNIHFGINLGFNRSHFNFLHHPVFQQRDSVMVVESINSTGLNLAWLVNKNLTPHLDLRLYPLNLTFTEKAFQYNLKYPDKPAGESEVTIKKIQSISMAFPVQLKFSSDRINNFKVYMMAGIKGEYDLAANAGARKAENLVKLNRFDYGIEAGMGFHFFFEYFVCTPEVKFGWGLSNLHARDPNLKFSNVLGSINSRMISFSITVE